MKVFGLLGKRVLTAAGRQGYVVAVFEKEGKFTGLKCADFNEREFFVPAASIKKIKSAVLCTGERGRAEGRPIRLGIACFDISGGFLGSLQDVTFCRGEVCSIRAGKKNYPFAGGVTADAVIGDFLRKLKDDVQKGGKPLFLKGLPVSEVKERAIDVGEYVQTTLKSI